MSLELADGALAALSVTMGAAVEHSRLRFCFEHVTVESSLSPYRPHLEPWRFETADEVGKAEIEAALADFAPQPEHFEGQSWTEDNDGFTSRWSSEYDKKNAIAASYVRINTGNTSVIRERVYDLAVVTRMIEAAGFQILGTLDAENWKPPRRKTTRVDIVAVKRGAPGIEKRFKKAVAQVRQVALGG